jgi:hypothetical protein
MTYVYCYTFAYSTSNVIAVMLVMGAISVITTIA